MSDFASRLRDLREQAGLTQVELADRAGLHRFGLAKLEQGHREPSWATVQALAKALNVSCEAFQQAPPAPSIPPLPDKPKAKKTKAEKAQTEAIADVFMQEPREDVTGKKKPGKSKKGK